MTAAPVYLIAAPCIKNGPWWEEKLTSIRQLVPDVEMIDWDGLPEAFRSIPVPEQPARLAKVMTGAIAVAAKFHGRRWIGRHARTEIEAFTTAGKRVYVYAADSLTPWEQCTATTPDDAPWLTPIEIIIRAKARSNP